MAEKSSMDAAVKAVSYNMILQISFRFGTFFMNAILLRYISSEMLGVVNVRLTLLYTTILFSAREAFRKACLSRIETDNHEKSYSKFEEERKKIVNLIWSSVAVGFFSVISLSTLWIYYLEQPSKDILSDYQRCCIFIAISALLELTVEPMWIFGQRYSFVTLKVLLEGVLITSRCIISTILVICIPSFGLLSFAIGFMASAILYVILYYTYFLWCINKYKDNKDDECLLFPFKNYKDLFPDLQSPFTFPEYYKNLVTSFYKQSLLKQFLTEGERYVMTIFSILSFGEQGVYDVINNLGSLAARFIFMPIEESYYVYFSQILIRGKSASDQPNNLLKQASASLSLVIKFVSLVGFIILVFGHNYSYLLLDLYGGKILSGSEGPLLLKMYCLYVLFIAINGITECFMFAAMSKKRVDQYNYKMLTFSVVFLFAALLFTKYLGAIGFILANCLNMGLRIGESIKFIRMFFKDTPYKPLLSIKPSNEVLTALFLSFFITYASERWLCYTSNIFFQIIHVTVGGVCLLVVAVCIYLSETELVNFAKDLWSKRKIKNT